MLRGDLGTSWRTGLPVLEMITSRLQVTLELTLGAMLVALAVGIPLGIVSARRENTRLDHAVRVLSLFSLSIPVFWQATMLILATSLWLDWAPAVDFVSPFKSLRANLAIIALPSLALGTAVAAVFMRMTRSTLLEVMRQDYIRTARAKGLREQGVVWGHALKNSLIPLITVAGVQVGYLLGGVVVTEEVFTLPGVGRLILWAVFQRDYPLVRERSCSSACSSCCRISWSIWSTPTWIRDTLWLTPCGRSCATGSSSSGRVSFSWSSCSRSSRTSSRRTIPPR